VRKGSVLAFQQLWNANNPQSRIAEGAYLLLLSSIFEMDCFVIIQFVADGLYGPATQNAILNSPASGFPKVP
jgi:hypothetical protein